MPLGWARLAEVSVPRRFGDLSRRVGSAVEGAAQDVAGAVVPLAVDALDVNDLVERVDLDAVLDKLDLNRVLARIDIDTLLDHVDLNAVLDRVDLDRLVARLDMDQILQRVDINEIVARTDLEAIITRATTGVAAEALDAVRSQAVGLDGFIHRWVDRLLGRHDERPAGPAALLQTRTAP
jgi:hypothetical protein